MNEHHISTSPLSIDQVESIINSGAKLKLSDDAIDKIQHTPTQSHSKRTLR